MKQSTSELSFVVVILIAISMISTVVIFFINNGEKIIIDRFNDVLDINKDSNVILNSNFKKNMTILLNNNGNVYKRENEEEKILKNNLETTTNFEIDRSIESKLKKETDKNLKNYKIKSASEYQYYRNNDSNYIVNVTSSDTNKEYYFTYVPKSNSLLNTVSYKNEKVIVKDISDAKVVSEKLKKNEYNSQFTFEKDYDESYLSKADINRSNDFKLDEDLINRIYENNIDNIVVLNTYKNDIIVTSASGFFLMNGIIATSWSYLNESLASATEIVAVTNSKRVYKISGIITVNQEIDLALLKVDSESDKGVKFGNLSVGQEFVLLGTFSGFGISGKIGINLKNDKDQTNALSVSKTNIGSPLWNKSGEVVGMVTSRSIDKDISNSISALVLQKYKNYYKKINFSDISTHSIKELQDNYYKYKIKSQNISKNILDSIWNKYKSIGNIENTVLLPIIKINSDYNKISIRYQNDIGIDNNILVQSFITELEMQKYRKKLDTNKKKVYKNDSFQVTIYYEFDYIIVIMEMI